MLCGETKEQEDGTPPRLFYAGFDGKTVHVMDDPNESAEGFLDACGVTKGTDEEARLRSRMQELDSARFAKLKADAERDRYIQEGARQKRWIEENAEAIRALHEASQRLSR
jgi:hypothetical protein